LLIKALDLIRSQRHEARRHSIEFAIEHKDFVPQLDQASYDLPGRGGSKNGHQRESGRQSPSGDGMPGRRPHAVELALASPRIEVLRVQILLGHWMPFVAMSFSRWYRPRMVEMRFLHANMPEMNCGALGLQTRRAKRPISPARMASPASRSMRYS
jgi:hypothetical protein